MRKILRPISKTPEDIIIVKGVFDFVGTYGVPIEITLDILKENNTMPDWIDYVDSAVKQGAKFSRVRLQLSNAVLDIYGGEFHKSWLERFDIVYIDSEIR